MQVKNGQMLATSHDSTQPTTAVDTNSSVRWHYHQTHFIDNATEAQLYSYTWAQLQSPCLLPLLC